MAFLSNTTSALPIAGATSSAAASPIWFRAMPKNKCLPIPCVCPRVRQAEWHNHRRQTHSFSSLVTAKWPLFPMRCRSEGDLAPRSSSAHSTATISTSCSQPRHQARIECPRTVTSRCVSVSDTVRLRICTRSPRQEPSRLVLSTRLGTPGARAHVNVGPSRATWPVGAEEECLSVGRQRWEVLIEDAVDNRAETHGC